MAENKGNKFCKDGAEGGKKEWVPQQKVPIYSGGKATDETFDCQCMKNCGSVVRPSPVSLTTLPVRPFING